jgi:hypothetical protein
MGRYKKNAIHKVFTWRERGGLGEREKKEKNKGGYALHIYRKANLECSIKKTREETKMSGHEKKREKGTLGRMTGEGRRNTKK